MNAFSGSDSSIFKCVLCGNNGSSCQNVHLNEWPLIRVEFSYRNMGIESHQTSFTEGHFAGF